MSDKQIEKLMREIRTQKDAIYVYDGNVVLQTTASINAGLITTGINAIYSFGKTGKTYVDERDYRLLSLPIDKPKYNKMLKKYVVPKKNRCFYVLGDIYNNTAGELKTIQAIDLKRICYSLETCDGITSSVIKEILPFVNIKLVDEIPTEIFNNIEGSEIISLSDLSYLRSVIEGAKENTEVLKGLGLYNSLEESKINFDKKQRIRK